MDNCYLLDTNPVISGNLSCILNKVGWLGRRMVRCVSGQLVGWGGGLANGWSIGWVVKCIDGLVIGWSVGQMGGQVVGWSGVLVVGRRVVGRRVVDRVGGRAQTCK